MFLLQLIIQFLEFIRNPIVEKQAIDEEEVKSFNAFCSFIRLSEEGNLRQVERRFVQAKYFSLLFLLLEFYIQFKKVTINLYQYLSFQQQNFRHLQMILYSLLLQHYYIQLAEMMKSLAMILKMREEIWIQLIINLLFSKQFIHDLAREKKFSHLAD